MIKDEDEKKKQKRNKEKKSHTATAHIFGGSVTGVNGLFQFLVVYLIYISNFLNLQSIFLDTKLRFLGVHFPKESAIEKLVCCSIKNLNQ